MNALDLSGQITAPPPNGLSGSPKAWTRADLAPVDWTLSLTAEALAEVDAIVEAMRENPLPTLLLVPGQFELPACREVMDRVRSLLLDGIGFCLRRLGHNARLAPDRFRSSRCGNRFGSP